MSHTIVSIRFPDHVLQAIDQHAEQQGVSRTQYVLSWLPENHTAPPPADSETDAEPTD